MVPSLSELTSLPENDQLPPVAVVVNGPTVWALPESVIVSETVSPASAVPEAEALVWLAALTGSVTLVIATLVTVSLRAVFESLLRLPRPSVARTLYVIVPSLSELTSMPENDQLPPVAVVVNGPTVWVPSVIVSEIESPGSAVPEAETLVWFAAVTGSVTLVIETLVSVSLTKVAE